MQKSVYGETKPCVTNTSVDQQLTPYLYRLFNIMDQLKSKDDKRLAIERLYLLEEDIENLLEYRKR